MRRIDCPDSNIRGEHFDSLQEMILTTVQRPLNDAYKADYSAKRPERVRSGVTCTWRESMDYLRHGSDLFDGEYAEALRDVRLELARYLSATAAPRQRFDVVGGSVSVGRALAGQPDAFTRRAPQMRRAKAVNLYYSLSCPYGYSTHDRIMGGCTLMAIVEALERQGHQAAITLCATFSFREDSPAFLAEVMLKDCRTRLNVKKLQFPLASTTVLFHLGKWWLHRSPMVTVDLGRGEGQAVDTDPQRFEQAKAYMASQHGVYLSHVQMKRLGWDIPKVMDYVREQLARQ